MKDWWTPLAVTMVAVLVAGALPPASVAYDAAAEDGDAEEAAAGNEAAGEEDEAVNRGRLSVAVQNDFTNAYIFRGIMQERDGFIWQPSAELSLSLYESEETQVHGVAVGVGVWNSFQSEKTFADQSPSNLYETDWYPTLSVDLADGVNFTTIYYFYTSPNGAFDTVQEIEFDLAWDDSELLGRWAMAPWVAFALETDRTSFGNHRGSAVVLGVEPTLYEVDSETFPLAFSFPVELGLSIDDYYEEPGRSNDTFGYLSWGLTANLPITSIPERYGSWSFSVAGKGYYFSNALTRANSGDRLYPTVTGSLVFEY